MSTTFDVYPTTSKIPTYVEIIELAGKNVSALLKDYGICLKSRLVFDVRNDNHESQKINSTEPFNWEGPGYVWFYYEDQGGGTDAYFYLVNDIDRQCWEEEAETNARWHRNMHFIQTSLNVGHFWSFRRSVGQPALINLTYGFLASALAQLTSGMINSWDSAWDFERLPCTPAEFNKFWFRPEAGLSENTREWHQNCLESIRRLQNPPT